MCSTPSLDCHTRMTLMHVTQEDPLSCAPLQKQARFPVKPWIYNGSGYIQRCDLNRTWLCVWTLLFTHGFHWLLLCCLLTLAPLKKIFSTFFFSKWVVIYCFCFFDMFRQECTDTCAHPPHTGLVLLHTFLSLSQLYFCIHPSVILYWRLHGINHLKVWSRWH